MLGSPDYLSHFDWVADVVDALDAASAAAIIVALFTAALALATWWLARQTRQSIRVAERASSPRSEQSSRTLQGWRANREAQFGPAFSSSGPKTSKSVCRYATTAPV
jgi:hypothetical protein